MTIEIETASGLRSASGVIQISNSEGLGIPGPEAGGMSSNVVGQAVAIDIPGHPTLFALLSAPDSDIGAGGYAIAALIPERPDRGGDGKAWFHNLEIMKTRRYPALLPRRSYPPFVYFRDIEKSETIEQVDVDNMAPVFGHGTRIRRIIVQLTDDPITTGLQKRLRWLSVERDGGLTHDRGPFLNATFAQKIAFRNFTRGIRK